MAHKTYNTNICFQNKWGNSPYITATITKFGNSYDYNGWRVSIDTINIKVKFSSIGTGRTSNVQYTGKLIPTNKWTGEHGNGSYNISGSMSKEYDIRNLCGYTPGPHQTVYINTPISYKYKGYFLSKVVNTSSATFSANVPVFTPAVGGSGGGGNIGGIGSGYTWRWYTFSGNWWGVSTGNCSFYYRLLCNGTIIASGGNNSGSGSLSGRYKFNSPGNYNLQLQLVNNTIGSCINLASRNVRITYPPPEPPEGVWINNTTPRSINTTQTKSISGNWGVEYAGYPQDYLLYEYEAYSTAHGRIASGQTYGSSFSFNWNIPVQHTGCNIYWKVRARNSVGWSAWSQSNQVEVFWAYNEPKIITSKKLAPARFQLFDGTTNITFTGESNVNGWGDRPGNKQVEYRLYRGNTKLKDYGRVNFTGTGVFNQTMNYSVYETELHQTYTLRAHKMLSGTEYSTSNDPRYPNIGQNNCAVGNITFYEVIAKVNGTFKLEPTVIISGIATNVIYEWEYDKQSSEKVTFFIEMFRVSENKVTKIVNLDENINKSGTFSGIKSAILVDPQQADEYEVRLKATVTELLGNTHTYTLKVLKPEVYNPPVAALGLNKVTKPLPTNNASASLAKQDTDIKYDYNYFYGGISIVKVILVTVSSFGTEQTDMVFTPNVTPYYNSYTRVSTGEFELGSKVQSYIRIYYQIYGYSRMYDVVSNIIDVDITPTRYLYYLTQIITGEKQLNKIHPLVDKVDRTSKHIFIEEPKEP